MEPKSLSRRDFSKAGGTMWIEQDVFFFFPNAILLHGRHCDYRSVVGQERGDVARLQVMTCGHFASNVEAHQSI